MEVETLNLKRDRISGQWTSSVRCPHCGGLHYHGFGRKEHPEDLEEGTHRVADCGKGSYTVVKYFTKFK